MPGGTRTVRQCAPFPSGDEMIRTISNSEMMRQMKHRYGGSSLGSDDAGLQR